MRWSIWDGPHEMDNKIGSIWDRLYEMASRKVVKSWEKLRKLVKSWYSFEQEESELELTHWVRQEQGWAWRMTRQQWAAWRMPSWTCSQLHRWSEKAHMLSFNSNQNKRRWWPQTVMKSLVMMRIWLVDNDMTKGDARLVKRVVKRVGQRMRG